MFLKKQLEPARHFTAGAASPWVVASVGGAAECWASRGSEGLRAARGCPSDTAAQGTPSPVSVLGQPGPPCPSMSTEGGT